MLEFSDVEAACLDRLRFAGGYVTDRDLFVVAVDRHAWELDVDLPIGTFQVLGGLPPRAALGAAAMRGKVEA